MLTLSETQWANLKGRDTLSFVAAVCDQYLTTAPEMAGTSGREAVLIRMQEAYDYAIRVGFTSTPHIVRWLYLTADAPGVYDDKVVEIYLRKPGATPEQRLDDMLAVIMHELKQLEGSN